MDRPGAETQVVVGGKPGGVIRSRAEEPTLRPNVSLVHSGERRLRTALVLPGEDHSRPLPVLLDPYGGPHAQRVVRAQDAFLQSQWLADQGFAVMATFDVAIEKNVTPRRGPPDAGNKARRVCRSVPSIALTDPPIPITCTCFDSLKPPPPIPGIRVCLPRLHPGAP